MENLGWYVVAFIAGGIFAPWIWTQIQKLFKKNQ